MVLPQTGYWDDGGTTPGDGCDATCAVETGWICTPGDSSSPSSCQTEWGDGKTMSADTGATFWDDGNTSDDDGCDSTCAVETGWTWTTGDTTTASTCSTICGDGKTMPTNTDSGFCDDGNTVSGDGCNSSCQVETGWTCTPGDLTTAASCSTVCGDGKTTSVDTDSNFCDDGNTVNGDGWDSSCQVETGWTWTTGDISTASSWEAISADGPTIPTDTSTGLCDDGNTVNGDGCSSSLQIETGWTCTSGDLTTASTCSTIWGDGLAMSVDTATNFCDDGNTADGDGCSSKWIIESEYICSTGDTTTASVWTKDNTMSEQVANSVAATQSAIGAGATAAIGVSLLNMSSPNALWAMANQAQSLLLLVAMSVYLPDDIVQFITANNLMQFSFGFIPLYRITLISVPIKWFDTDSLDSKYETVGLESNSTFVNVLSTIVFFLFLVCLHLTMTCIPKWRQDESSSKVRKIYNFIVVKLWEFFTFAIYIRIFIEAFQFMLLSCMSEISIFNTSSDAKMASLGIAFLILIFCLAVFTLGVYQYKTQKHRCLSEFESGLKDSKVCKLFTCFFLLRKIILVVWVIVSAGVYPMLIAILASIIELVYMVWLAITRPFKETQNNIIEILNEIIFTIVCAWLIIFDTESDWTQGLTDIYMYILIGNNMAIVFVLVISLFVNLAFKIKNCFSKKSKIVIKTKVEQIPRDNQRVSLKWLLCVKQRSTKYFSGSSTYGVHVFKVSI